MFRRCVASIFFLFLVLPGAAGAQQARAAAPPQLDAYIERVRQTFEVPGLAVTIVKDGQVVAARGYGVRRLAAPEPVDARTLFGIASNSKVFTAIAVGQLVEDSKVQWDAPVIRYLPWFRMSDPYVTRELTVRDLFVHRSGLSLGAGDLLWWPPTTYSREEVARRLQFIPLATSFRAAYAYDNVLYLVAGEVIRAVTGQTWEDYVAARILRRAGMSGSTVRHADAVSKGNLATTHAPVEGKVRVVKPFDGDNANPAAGIYSNAEDMGTWLAVLLAGGRLPDGSLLFSENTWRQVTALVTPQNVGNPPAELPALRANFRGYGLGLGIADFRGRKILTHTGGLPGAVSRVLLIPDIQLGVAVLTNQESGAAFDAIAFHVADHYLGEQGVDWAGGYQKVAARQQASFAAAEKKAADKRDPSSRPPLPLAKYAGTYSDAWYGDVVIEDRGGKPVMRFTHTPVLVGDLEHWQYDTFVVRWHDRELRADAYVTFALNPDGSIDQVKMKPVSPATDFSFDFQDLLLRPVKAAK